MLRNDYSGLNQSVSKHRRAIFQIGPDRLNLIGTSEQRALFTGLGGERGQRVAGDGLIEQPLRGTDRVRTAPRDLAGSCQCFSEGIGDHARGEAVAERFLRGNNSSGVGQFADHILPRKRAHELKSQPCRAPNPTCSL